MLSSPKKWNLTLLVWVLTSLGPATTIWNTFYFSEFLMSFDSHSPCQSSTCNPIGFSATRGPHCGIQRGMVAQVSSKISPIQDTSSNADLNGDVCPNYRTVSICIQEITILTKWLCSVGDSQHLIMFRAIR